MGTGPRYNLPAIRKAATITYAAFCDIKEFIKPGMTERQLAWRMSRLLSKHGSEKTAFPVIVAFGKSAANMHHKPGKNKLKPGDMIKIDAGAVYKTMRGDVTRTFFLGTPDKKFIKRYQAVLKAQITALPFYKPNQVGISIDAKARNYFKKQRLGKYFIHSLGHGVGRAIHQAPWITPTKKGNCIIQAGQVITLEPGLYETGWGGIRIEDMVEVTKTKSKILGKAPKNLKDIIISTD